MQALFKLKHISEHLKDVCTQAYKVAFVRLCVSVCAARTKKEREGETKTVFT